MYFKPQKDGDQVGTSQILISDKARASSGKEELKIIQQDPSIAPDYWGLPYIVILVDLGLAKSSFKAQVDSSKDMCLWIYAKGLNAKMYSFLQGRTELECILNDLWKQQHPPASKARELLLKDQVQFGKSSKPHHMNLKWKWANNQ